MRKFNLIRILAVVSILFAGCKKNDSDNNNGDGTNEEGSYVLLTTDWGTAPDWIGSGYFGIYKDIPSGTISNIGSQSSQSNAYGGFVTYKKWVFVRANAEEVEGVTRYSVAASGKLQQDGFISASGAKFVIIDDNTGYYYDADRGTKKVQKFNPTTMQRTGEIDLDIEAVTQGESNVFTGLQTLAAKEGKLFVSVTYSPKDGDGFLDNTKNYTMAVIDVATDTFEKLITTELAYNQGYPPSEYPGMVTGEDGAIYFLERGDRVGEDGEWIEDRVFHLFRIKKGATEFDTWNLQPSDFGKDNSTAMLWSIAWHKGKLYVDLGDIATYENFEVYAIDPETKSYTKITGLPPLDFGHTAGNVQPSADGNLYIKVKGLGDNIAENAFYKLNAEGTSASKLFDVSAGGDVRRFTYLK